MGWEILRQIDFLEGDIQKKNEYIKTTVVMYFRKSQITQDNCIQVPYPLPLPIPQKLLFIINYKSI